MRVITWIALIGIAATAPASYELGLIAQGTRVYRWDPVSGASFGSFSTMAPVTALTSYRSTGEAYVLSGSFVYRYDYSTGEYRGRWSVGGGAASLNRGMNDGEILVGYASGVRRYSVATGAQIGVPLAWSGTGFTYADGAVAMRTTGTYYLTAERTTYFEPYDYLIGVDASSAWVGNYRNSSFFGTGTSVLRTGDVHGNDVAFMNQFSATVNDSAPMLATRLSGNSLTLTGEVYQIQSTYRAYLQFTHEDALVHVFHGAGTWTYVRGPHDTLLDGEYRTLPFLNSAQPVAGLSMIVAPEPASLAALGLGVLALLRRRRS